MVYALDLSNPAVNPSAKFASISSLLNIIIPIITIGAGIIFFVLLVLAGFQYITSDGKPENLEKVKQLLIQAIIGFIIVISSYLVVKLAGSIFNLSNLPF